MARRPRPVNPDEGPVQAFAFDLRALRESAGNPTYRALARIAGYSATTLGDAAGGVQLPTLEVMAAYVGACGGDVAAWRARWQEVNRELACEREREQAAGAEADAHNEIEAADPESGEPAIEPASPPAGRARQDRPRRSGPWIVATAVVAGLTAVAVVAAFALRQSPANAAASASKGSASHSTSRAASSSVSASAHCPAVPAPGTAVSFTGMTYGLGANVRDGASLQSPVRFRIPAGCGVGFSGYCLGDVVMDETADTPDMRWFIIPGVGEVASAIVHGDPPASLTAQPCPNDVPGPAAISLAVARTGTGGGVVELTATGSRLWIVGFAAYYADAGSGTPARWHQFGFGQNQSPGAFSSSPLRLDDLAGPGTESVPVVAVACVGGDGPTSVLAGGAVRPAAPQTLLPLPAQSAASRDAAEQAACEYPGESTGD